MHFGQTVEHKKAETQSSTGQQGSQGSVWLDGRCECEGEAGEGAVPEDKGAAHQERNLGLLYWELGAGKVMTVHQQIALHEKTAPPPPYPRAQPSEKYCSETLNGLF